MLRELRIENYAVIEELSLRLDVGLNALAGETGAGKSIIVGALSLALGERATTDVIRAGEQRAVVEAYSMRRVGVTCTSVAVMPVSKWTRAGWCSSGS